MNQNNFTFESENLVVDWISFKFQDLDNPTIINIANYIEKIGFNSYQQSGKLAKPIKESLLVSSQNKFEVLFVKEGPYWQGTTLQFSGLNATFFSSLAQKGLISWGIFSSGVLSRFDLYFSRNTKTEDKEDITEFFENCQRKFKQTNRNFSCQKNSKGLILKIGNRRSNHFSRIYQTNNSLKFEHEMKGKFLQDSHTLLVENRLEEFEYKLIKYFLFYFGKLLPLHHLYLDWLVVKLRPIRKQQIPHLFLNTDYIESKIEGDRKNFVMLLQFLTYAQHLPFETEYLGSTAYRQVGFSIDHFLKFQNPTVKSTNYYQLKKARQFLDELQNGIFITSFSRYEFQRLVLVPKVKIIKSKKLKSWIARVWLVEELFYYRYPFLLLDFFKQKITKDQFEVIKVFSSVDIEKEFFIKKFLDSYPSVISNQRIANIKRYFIELVKVLQEYDLIESNYKIMSDGYYHSVQ